MSDSNLGIEYVERNKIYSVSKEFYVFRNGPSFYSKFLDNIGPFHVAADIPVFLVLFIYFW